MELGALELLSAPAMPEELREEATARAEQGTVLMRLNRRAAVIEDQQARTGLLVASPLHKQQAYPASRIDECKDWADKALALKSYAKQAHDQEMFNTAQRIQDRALRQAGKLLASIQKANVRRNRGKPISSSRSKAARDAGLSPDQAVSALRVANVDEAEFERDVESETPPTVAALAKHGTKPRPNKARKIARESGKLVEAIPKAVGGSKRPLTAFSLSRSGAAREAGFSARQQKRAPGSRRASMIESATMTRHVR